MLRGLLVLGVMFSGTASSRAASVALDQLLAGGTIQSGDKLFYGFTNFLEVTNLPTGPAGAASIIVQTITGSMPGEYGISFIHTWSLIGPNLAYDLKIDFSVKIVLPIPPDLPPPGPLGIKDATLNVTGHTAGDGVIRLAENINIDDLTNTPLASLFVQIDKNNNKFIDHVEFPTVPFPTAIEISKDFAMWTGTTAGDETFVSHFDQVFSQTVPEPGALAILGVLGLGSLGYRRRTPKA